MFFLIQNVTVKIKSSSSSEAAASLKFWQVHHRQINPICWSLYDGANRHPLKGTSIQFWPKKEALVLDQSWASFLVKLRQNDRKVFFWFFFLLRLFWLVGWPPPLGEALRCTAWLQRRLSQRRETWSCHLATPAAERRETIFILLSGSFQDVRARETNPIGWSSCCYAHTRTICNWS